MTEHLVQGSEEWKQARIGKVTASRVADVTAKTKTGWGASRKNYMAELVAERLTGYAAEGFTSGPMQWGTETEPQARIAYEFFQDEKVQQVGFVNHPTIEMAGASPDGYVGDDGLIEIKAPLTATHIDTLLSGKIPEKYVTQMQWQMACSGRQWCDFVSYDPRLPEDMKLFVQRLPRDQAYITSLEIDVRAFLAELDGTVKALVAKLAKSAA